MRDIFIMIHFIGLIMGVGTSFTMMVLGRASAKMEPAERIKFALSIQVMRRMGQTGLALLILTGFYLMTPYWANLANMPYMIAKLVLVAILTVLVIIVGINASRALKGDPQVHLMKNAKIGPVTMLIGLAIIVMAVMSFH